MMRHTGSMRCHSSAGPSVVGPRRFATRPDSGFTLIEILMATVLMLIVAIGTITALMFSGQASASTAQRSKALNLANEYVEKARNLPYDRIGTNSDGGLYGDPPGDIHTPDVVGDFTVSTTISWQRDANRRSQYKNVEVSVAWTRPTSGSVKLTTSVFGKTNLTNVGDLELTLLDHDGTNKPIVGVDVTVVPQGSTPRTVRTDANGVAYFGRLPTGQATVTMNAADWVFDRSVAADFPAVSVATGDVLSSFTIKGQKPSTLRVQVVGTHSDGLPGAAVSTVVMGQTLSGITDANGYVAFAMLPHGTYAVTAARADRETVTASMVVPSPAPALQPVTGSITLHDPASILFKVTGASNDLKAGATVTLYTQAGSAVAAGTTGSDGLVTLQAAVAGTYYASSAVGAAHGRFPSTGGTFMTVSTGDFGNHATPIGQASGGLVIQVLEAATGTFNITTKSSTGIRANSTIRITNSSGAKADYTSDAAGKIVIVNLPLGTYTFEYKGTNNYHGVSSPSSTTLSSNGQSVTFDVKW